MLKNKPKPPWEFSRFTLVSKSLVESPFRGDIFGFFLGSVKGTSFVWLVRITNPGSQNHAKWEGKVSLEIGRTWVSIIIWEGYIHEVIFCNFIYIYIVGFIYQLFWGRDAPSPSMIGKYKYMSIGISYSWNMRSPAGGPLLLTGDLHPQRIIQWVSQYIMFYINVDCNI